ncbi:nocturnin isoform X2 [Engraulis encrasicolus]|uniref:nocturnin isoform X2 n=1 Tax=Engraulis encrasicolus TaxID=184585 RepID=UPI002FCF37FA
MNPVRRCSALLHRDFTSLCLSSLGSAPKTTETPKKVPALSSRHCHQQASGGEVLTSQPQVKPGGASSVTVNARIGPMGSGSSSSRLFGTLAQTLSSPSIPLQLPALGEEDGEGTEDESGAYEPADPDLLLHECKEALRNRPPRWHRHFQHPQPAAPSTPPPPPPHDRDMQPIRVMQWNILAQALGEGKDGFVRCPLEALNWAERKYLILEEILTYQPDILCLQEVDHYFDTFQPVLASLGYRGTFCPKPWSPCLDVENNNGPDGCALFFRRDRFRLLATSHLRLSAMMLKTNQVAVVCTLRCRHTGRRFCVAVTHLKARSGWESLRSAQGSSLLQSLRAITMEGIPEEDAVAGVAEGEEGAGVPLIVCGDFNAEPWEDVYQRFASSPLGLDSAYKGLSADGRTEPAYTSWKIRRSSGESRHTLDYIWYSSRRFHVDAVLELPSEEQIGPDRLPSYHYPSDHLSLVCDFSFAEPPAQQQQHRLL